MTHTNEHDLIIKFAGRKAGGDDGQLIIDDVELERSRDNRTRHGIGNEEPQVIEKGNRTYTFSTTAFMSSAMADALQRIDDGTAETQAVYVKDQGNWVESSGGIVFNRLRTSSSDDGDTKVEIDADLLGLNLSRKN